MAVLRKPRIWAAVGLLFIAASAAAFVVSGGVGGGAFRPAPSPDRGNGPVLETPRVDAGTNLPMRPQVGGGTVAGSSFMIITSDPQYPWTPAMDGHKVQCGEERACSRALIEEQYMSINRFVRDKRVLGTFINGDLTAFGHDWQIQYMKSAIGSIRTPVYLGLGNHDYENNVDDCWENSCVRSSVQWFRDHMAKLPLDAFDVRDNRYFRAPWNRRDVHGSLGWTKRFGDITVIQVNNYPEYKAYAQGLEIGYSGRAVTYVQEQLFINSGMRWLDQQLRRERAAGQAIIVMMHIGWGSEALKGLLNHYDVSAVFAGHVHDWVGPEPKWNFGEVPIYFSGSAVRRSYLIAERVGQNAELKLWVVEDNNEYNRRLAANIPLKRNGRHLDSALKDWVTIRNAGPRNVSTSEMRARVGYVGNDKRTVWFDEETVVEIESWQIPKSATQVLVDLKRKNGGPFGPWRHLGFYAQPTGTHLCLGGAMDGLSSC